MLILDREMRIRRVTPITHSVLNVSEADQGRCLGELQMRIGFAEIEPLIRCVLEQEKPEEGELQDQDGRWHILRVRPYRTATGQVNGIVLMFTDVHDLRTARNDADVSRLFADTVLGTSRTPFVVLREDLCIKLVNDAFHQLYGTEPKDTENQHFLEISGKRFDLTGLRAALGRILVEEQHEHKLEFKEEQDGKLKHIHITVRLVQPDTEKMLLLALEDITARKEAELALLEEQQRLKDNLRAGYAELEEARKLLRGEASGREQAETKLEESRAELFRSREELRHLSASLLNAHDAERRRVSRELHDDLSQKVAKLQFDIEILEQKVPFSDLEGAKAQLRAVGDQAACLSNELRRVAHQLHPATLDNLGLTVALRAYVHEFSQSTGIPVELISKDVPKQLPLHIASCVYRIVQETLRNVAKHAGEALVEVRLSATPEALKLMILDNGNGFDMESARAKGGLGLIGMEERVRLLGGTIAFQTRPGDGVRIDIQIPLEQGQGS